MNFTITKQKISQVMVHINKILANTVILPIYKAIQISVTQDAVKILVSDGTVSMIEYLKENVEVYECGECLINGKLFNEIIKNLNDGKVQVRRQNNLVNIKCNKAEMNLHVINEGEYPNISFDFPSTKFKVDVNVLKEAINKTIFAASDQQTRPVLGGLNFNVSEDVCTITGTDSYRLSKITIPIVCDQEINITIPKKMLTLAPFLQSEGDAFLYFDQHKAMISNDTSIVQSVLLDGAFPDVASLIPNTFETEVFIPVEQFKNALERTSFITEDNVTIVMIDVLNDEIMLTCDSKQIGSSIESIEYSSISGNKNVKFYFNQRYMLEALKVLEGRNFVLKFISDSKPFLITENKDSNHMQLLLPVRHL